MKTMLCTYVKSFEGENLVVYDDSKSCTITCTILRLCKVSHIMSSVYKTAKLSSLKTFSYSNVVSLTVEHCNCNNYDINKKIHGFRR